MRYHRGMPEIRLPNTGNTIVLWQRRGRKLSQNKVSSYGYRNGL